MSTPAKPSSNPSCKRAISRRQWLGAASAGIGLGISRRVEAAPQLLVPKIDEVENLVIGTGYGGSVAAWNLAHAGQRVVMLEMGQRWNKAGPDGKIFNKMTDPDWRAMWFRDRLAMPLDRFLGMDVVNRKIGKGPGVLDRRNLGFMNVYLGRGVGGGSLVNGAMAPRPRRSAIERELPQVEINSFFDRYLPYAEKGLRVNSIPKSFRDTTPWYQFSRTGAKTAQAAGYKVVNVPSTYNFDYMQKEARGEVPRSALGGQVILGNDHGKFCLNRTFLRWAEGTGLVELRTGSEAISIHAQNDGRYIVVVEHRDSRGALLKSYKIRCKRVFLGAGSVGSTELLLRSKALDGLKNLSGEVGKGWGPNGNTMFARANHAWHPTGDRQSTMPVQGVDLWDSNTPCFTEICPMPTGIETWCSMYLAVTDNRRKASFHYDLSKNKLTLDWSEKDADASVKIAKAAFDRVNDEHNTIYRTDLFANGKPFSRNFSYHPLGGAVLGRATDAFGRVLGHPGLYVTDGALIPGILGVNPFLTITALSARLMDDVLKNGA